MFLAAACDLSIQPLELAGSPQGLQKDTKKTQSNNKLADWVVILSYWSAGIDAAGSLSHRQGGPLFCGGETRRSPPLREDCVRG